MKRLLSIALCIAMSLSLLSFTAYASGKGLHNFQSKYAYQKGQFTDVANGAWFESNVEQVYNLGLMTGNSSSTFNPSGKITQAEALTIAARIHKIYTTGSDDFSDIKQEMQDMNATIWEWCNFDERSPAYKEFYSAWYAPYAYYLYTRVYPEGRGYYPQFPVLSGEPDYAPFIDTQTPITRQIFVSYLIGALPESELQQINTVDNGGIPDVTYADDPDVYLLYRAGILTGSDSSGTFNPTSNITRAEVAAIIARMVDPSLRKHITLTNPQSSSDVISISAASITINETTTIIIDTSYKDSDYPDGISLNAEFDSSIIEVEWGDWDGWSIPLKIIPIQNGTATIRISVIENPSEYQDITVTVSSIGTGNANTDFTTDYTENDYYDLAYDAYAYLKTRVVYPHTINLISAYAGFLSDGRPAVKLFYYYLDSFGKTNTKITFYIYNKNGTISSFDSMNGYYDFISSFALEDFDRIIH